MEQAYFDARTHGWSREPIVEMVISSTLDDTLAPAGPACREPVLPARRAGTAGWIVWDDHRETVADLMIETVDRHAPNFKRSVLGRQILSPLDLERTFGLVGGDIFHGALDLGQMFSARPMLGHADYRGPLAGPLHVRLGHASGRRRDRIAGTQCGAGSAEGFRKRRCDRHPQGGHRRRRGSVSRQSARDARRVGSMAASTRTAVHARSHARRRDVLLVVRRVGPRDRRQRAWPDARGRSRARPNPGRSARCRGGSRACG